MLALQDVLYWGRFPRAPAGLHPVVGPVILAGGYLVFRRLQRNLAVEL